MKRFLVAAALMAAAMAVCAQGSREWPLTRANTGVIPQGGRFALSALEAVPWPPGQREGSVVYVGGAVQKLYINNGSGWEELPNLTAIANLFLRLTGGAFNGDIEPDPSFTYDLGSTTQLWRYIYSNRLELFSNGANNSFIKLYDSKNAESVYIDGETATITFGGVTFNHSGLDFPSAGNKVFNFQNSGAGNMRVLQDGANIPAISTGTSAPTSTPVRIGDIYVDTSGKKLYFAAGTDSSADWIIAN